MTPNKYKNRILASLTEAELARFEPHMSLINLSQGTTLVPAGRKAQYAYFIETGLVSIITTMRNGSSVQAAVVGVEGIAGIPLLLASDRTPNHIFMQISGSGFRLKATLLGSEFERSGKLREKLQRYAQAYLVQVSQIAACNRLHEVAERMARWLLMCQDRTHSDSILITHQSLGNMLGTVRPTVTLAAGTLQRAGLMRYSRGRVKILNRKGLEKVSCECYETIQQEYKRLGVL